MSPAPINKDAIWAKYRNERIKVRNMRQRQKKLKELIGSAWRLLVNVETKVGGEDKKK